MSRYREDIENLKNKACKDCHGLGFCDDADCNDIMFNTWQCTRCNGTGYDPEEYQIGE